MREKAFKIHAKPVSKKHDLQIQRLRQGKDCLDVSNLCKAMFPDGEISSKLQMCKTNYGIAPYFKKILPKDIKSSQFCSVLFDESFNRMLQVQQVDIRIRYWNKWTFGFVIGIKIQIWPLRYILNHSSCKDRMLKNLVSALNVA